MKSYVGIPVVCSGWKTGKTTEKTTVIAAVPSWTFCWVNFSIVLFVRTV